MFRYHHWFFSLSESEKKSIETIINDLRNLIMKIINSLQNLIDSFSKNEDINYDILLIFPIEKETRNFEEHSLTTDFIKDSSQTNDARLTSLLRQNNLLPAFKLTEIDVMNKIYTKYFGHLANQN
jgi:hypothetical protein